MEDGDGRASTFWTSQIRVAQWHGHIGDPTIAHAIWDYPFHTAQRIVPHGPSRRKVKARDE